MQQLILLLVIFPLYSFSYEIKAFPLNYGIGSTKCDRNISLFYLKVKNETNSFHFLTDASASINPPSVLFCSSSQPDLEASIKYPYICINNVTVEKSIEIPGASCFGFSFYGIRMMNGTSNITTREVNAQQMEWSLQDYSRRATTLDPDFNPATGELFLHYSGRSSENETIDYKIMFSRKNDYGTEMPKFLFSGGLNFQLDFSFKDLLIPKKYNSIQNHYDFMLHSNTVMTDDVDFYEKTAIFISDELTPGIFSVTDILFNRKQHADSVIVDGPDAYLQTKPVCYSDVVRENKNSRILKNEAQTLPTGKEKKVKKRLRRTLPGLSAANPTVLIDSTRLLPTTCGDVATYAATEFNSFSFALGFSQAPQYKLGKLATVILAISTSIPVLCLVGLSLFMLVKWLQKRRLEAESESNLIVTQQLL